MFKIPHAIIVEDNPHHARLMREYLLFAGFEVVVCRTILEGEAAARSLLDPAGPRRSAAVIIDQELPLQGQRDIEGSTLALLLHEEIAAGLLHPAHLVAISADMTPIRRGLAEQAGCLFAWQKPLRHQQIVELCDAMQDEPPPRVANRAIQTLAHHALDLLRSLLAEASLTARVWEADEVRLVLGYVSEACRLDAGERAQAERLIDLLGGASRATVRLRNSHAVLTEERQEILRRLLRREQKKDIQDDLPIGRTKLENEIRAICGLVAGLWSELPTVCSSR